MSPSTNNETSPSHPPLNSIRLAQLQRLRNVFESGERQGLRVLFLTGEAGIGKSYLVDAFLEYLESRDDILISHSACNYQTGRYEPYLPFKDLLKGLLDMFAHNQEENGTKEVFRKGFLRSVKALVDFAPDLINTFVPAGAIINKIGEYAIKELELNEYLTRKINEKPEDRFQLDELNIHKQYLGFLEQLSSESPVVLILEDLQWIDESSANLLLPLANKLKNSNILLLGSYRKNEIETNAPFLETVIIELTRAFGDIDIKLDPANDQEKQTLLDAILDERPNRFSEEFRSRMLNTTSGNPLFIHEILHSMHDAGQIIADEEGVFVDSVDLDWDHIPERLEAVVLGRLSKIDESSKSLLTTASVQGDSFLLQALSKLQDADEREMLRMVGRSLVREHGLLREGRSVRMKRKLLTFFYFANGMIQKYLYNDLLETEKIMLHEEIAGVLEDLYEGSVEEISNSLAYHYEKAELPAKAVVYRQMAGEHALRLSAFKEASLHFTRALEQLDRLDPDDDTTDWKLKKLELLVQLSVSLKPIEGWGHPKVIELYEQAYELGTEPGENATIAPVTFGLWANYLLHLRMEDALKFANKFLELAESLRSDQMILEAMLAISNTFFWMGKLVDSYQFACRVLEDYDAEKHKNNIYEYGQDPRSLGYLFKILCLSLFGKSEEAHQEMDAALKLAEQIKHPFSEAIILMTATWLHYQEQNYGEVELLADRLLELTAKNQFVFYRGIARMFHASVLINNGKSEEGLSLLEQGYQKDFLQSGGKLFHSVYVVIRFEGLFRMGDMEEAERLIDEGIRVSETCGELCYYSILLRCKAAVLEKRGNTKEGELFRNRAMEHAQKIKANLLTEIVERDHIKVLSKKESGTDP